MEVKALRGLTASPLSVTKLAQAIGKKQPTATEVLRRLAEKGIVTLTRMGMQKVARVADTKHAVLLRDILQKEVYIPWESLLSYSSMDVLFDAVSNGSTLGRLPKVTLWRTLRNLMAHGILVETDGKCSINDRHRELAEFVKEFQSYLASKLVERVAPKQAVVVWRSGFEFILRVPLGIKVDEEQFQRTALSRFAEFSVPLISDYDYYFHGQSKDLSLEGVVLHALLIERNNLGYITYSLILMRKNMHRINEQKLIAKAEALGLEKQVGAMLHFLKTKERVQGATLPTFEEFAAKASEYGV